MLGGGETGNSKVVGGRVTSQNINGKLKREGIQVMGRCWNL